MPVNLNRRTFINGSLGLALGVVESGAGAAPALPIAPVAVAPDDEHFWSAVAAQYEQAPGPVNLENGYCGMLARPVLDDYLRNVAFVNARTSLYLRQDYDASGKDAIREQVAAMAGVSPEEIVFTRGATESLQNLIVNYRLLKAGDTVMYADLDYDSMQYAMDFLAERRGVNVARIAIPEPAGTQAILDTYARALEANPKTRLLLLTHVSHRTGLVMPVAELARMARARNVDVIVDAAHSWGQLDFSIPDLQADFAGFNLHKWMGAPLGVGFIYIRKARLADIAPQLDDHDYPESDIRSRVHSGTTNTANVMTVPAALAFQRQIGSANKAARLRYLRDYWVSRVRGFKGVQILTPDEAGRYGAITSFRLAGKTTRQDNVAIARQLVEKHGVFAVQRGGVAAGNCVRITPALFTRPADLDRLVAGLKAITEA
jgi:isopenicillin-N epimerase